MFFYGVSISVEQMALLNGLPIKHLNLDTTSLGDDALVHVAGLPSLESLELKDAQITDEGLKHVEVLSNLKQLYLVPGPGVSPAGLERLKRALPQTRIRVEGTGL